MVIKYYKFTVLYEKNSQFPLSFKLFEKDYKKITPYSYLIKINNGNIVLSTSKDEKIFGSESTLDRCSFGFDADPKKIVKIYFLKEFGGGRFVIYKNNVAELTIYGSGVPILGSSFGILQEIKNKGSLIS